MKKIKLFCKKNSNELREYFSKKEELRQVRAEYKLTKKANKASEKARKNTIKQKQCWFHFFTKWFFIGIILVMISICISFYTGSLNTNNGNYLIKPILVIVSGIFSTVGISLFVGCVFDFSKNSEAFISFISKILSDIVVSKTFLSSLGVKDKEQALNLILKPEAAQIEQYANINKFFNKQIKEAMTMFDVNFKTNVTLNVVAYKDTSENKVYCETTLTYTVYKLNNKFEPLETMFEKEGSASESIKIISPNGEEKLGREETEEVEIGGVKFLRCIQPIPEECEKYDHLKVKKVVREPGSDHWIHYIWQSVTPYEGVTCRVQCYDGLTIKNHMIFDNKAYYHVEKSDDGTRMDITSSQWLDSDTGFSFVISE